MHDEDERVVAARAALASARCVLADLDGTLIFGDRAAGGAPELTRRYAGRLAVVSNYSTVTAAQMSRHLATMDLVIEPPLIFLAGELAIRQLAEQAPGARLLCLMAAPMCQLAADLGLQLVEAEPDILLIGRDLDLTYPRLAAAMRAVHGGARVCVSNLDLSHPGAGGRPVPETGALVRAITAAQPQAVLEVMGKPSPQLFLAALDALGCPREAAVMLGDNPDTDGVGARELGIPTILIGASDKADIARLSQIVA